jgi:RHS repeat-associated protein
VDGKPVELAPDGTARVYFSAPGNGRLEARAFDAAGNVGTALGRVSMRSGEEDGGGNPAPEATITSVSDGATVGGFVNIVGTAAAPDFVRYVLSYRRIENSSYKTILHATTQVTAGSLGKWDTTLLENDNYVLKLEVYDTFGSFAAVELEVSVSSNLKLGNFRLSFEDLTIPVAGIPITIARTYDTLRADRDGDFGFGWRMEYRNTDLRTSLPKSGLEDIGIYTPFKGGTKVFLTMPGGTREGFTFTPEYKVLPGFGLSSRLIVAFPKFTSDRGVTSTLSAGSGALIANDYGELFASAGIPWNPASPDFGGYTLTTREGLIYRIDGATGLMTSASDRNGNTLAFTENGISSSSGNVSITIERDVKGRIRAIVDPIGKKVQYSYSSSGDLSSVMDREENTTQLRYRTDRPHYLDSIIDPLGRTGIRTEYGPDGRWVRASDADGNTSQTHYDLDNDRVISQDARGYPTTVVYDSEGNIVSQTDALGGVISYTYDSSNRIMSRTDPGSGTTRFSYDTMGRETERTLSNGSTSRWTYNNLGDVISSTNPLGQTTRYEYDAQGNRTSVVDPTGSRTQFDYDSRGLLLRTTDASGYFTENTYDAAGRQIALRQADGSVVTLAVDSLGNQTEAATTLSTSEGSINVTVSSTRNANGRLLSSTDAVGNTTNYSYDAAGKPIAILRPGQQAETITYNALGRPVSLVSTSGVTTIREYDSVGNTVSSTTAGIRSETTFDALGRPTEVHVPGGETMTARFDAAGRPIQIKSGENTPRTMVYDGAGQLVGAVNINGESNASYDAVGRVISRTDSIGTTTYEYDAAGRIIRVTDPFGASTITTHDARGQVIAITDAANRTTRYAYDGMKRLIEVIDTIGGRTRYGYDELGRLISETDAIGRVTRNEYDVLGRRVALVQPDGTRQTFTYDRAGRLIGTVNAEGQSTQFDYDSRGFLTRLISSTETVTYTRNQVGLPISVTDSRGTATVEYDSNYRVNRRTEGDGRWVAYAYDSLGRIERISSPNNDVRYAYDGEGRVNSITDASGGATLVNYDTQGRAVAWIYPNGDSEIRTYDSAGRTATMRLVRGTMTTEERRYTYDILGRLSSTEQVAVGTTAYQYDMLDRLTIERFTSKDGFVQETSYTYDAVGNRLSRTTASGVEHYQYDLGGRLVAVTGVDPRTYAYDEAGRVIREERSTDNFTTYAWDSDDRLIQASVTSPSGTKQVDYLYDPAGNLMRRTEEGVVENYLVDANRPLAEIFEVNNSTTGTTRYAYRHEGILSSSDSQGRRFYHADRQGTAYATSDSNGVIVSLPANDAFGRAEGVSGHFFAGQRRDPLTGLDENRARRYDPNTGRFLSRDAFAGYAVNPMSQHDYLYANASPTNGSDPTGFFTISDLTTSNYITQLLISGLSTSIIGSGLALATGGTEWSGPSIAVNIGINSFGAMLLTSEPTKQNTRTRLLQISIAESLKTPDIFGAIRDHVRSKPLSGSGFPGITEQFVSVGFDLLLSGGANNVTFGNSIMLSANFFGTGYGGLGAFLGGYVSAGLSVQGGVLLALPAIAYGMLTLLSSGSFNGANGLGVSVTAAGFSAGYSEQDITLTNAGSIGFSLSVGFSFALPIYVDQEIIG